jgi:hypothetical protein
MKLVNQKNSIEIIQQWEPCDWRGWGRRGRETASSISLARTLASKIKTVRKISLKRYKTNTPHTAFQWPCLLANPCDSFGIPTRTEARI